MKRNIYIILALLLLLAIIFGAQWGWKKRQDYVKSLEPIATEVVRVPEVEGKAQTPPGLPEDLLVETKDVVESLTTKYLAHGAVQSSFTYRTTESIETRYAEYLAYMQKAGYTIVEREANGVKMIEGEKDKERLSIALSIWENLTVVQIAYLTF